MNNPSGIKGGLDILISRTRAGLRLAQAKCREGELIQQDKSIPLERKEKIVQADQYLALFWLNVAAVVLERANKKEM